MTNKIYHGTTKHISKCDDHTFWLYSPGTKLQMKWDTHLPVDAYCNNHVQVNPTTFKCLGHTKTEDFIPAQEEWKKTGWTQDWPGLEQWDRPCVYHGQSEQIFWLYSPGTKLLNKWDTHLPVDAYCNNHIQVNPTTFKCLGHTNRKDFIPAQEEWIKSGWTKDWPGLEKLDCIPCEEFNDALIKETPIIFKGPDNENQEKIYQYFDSPVNARYIRFYPGTWKSHISMRAGVLVQKNPGTITIIASDYILDNPKESARSYSSVFENNPIGTGHAQSMLDSKQAWSVGAGKNDENQWMTIDLGSIKPVGGVVTQGRSISCANQMVTSFKVGYSIDGTQFTMTQPMDEAVLAALIKEKDKQRQYRIELNTFFLPHSDGIIINEFAPTCQEFTAIYGAWQAKKTLNSTEIRADLASFFVRMNEVRAEVHRFDDKIADLITLIEEFLEARQGCLLHEARQGSMKPEKTIEQCQKDLAGKKMEIKNHTNTTPQFGEMDNNNSRTCPIGKYDDFVGSWTPQGTSPTIQIGVIGSHPMTICIHQSFNRTDIGVVDKYEYTTPNVPIIIQRTLAFGYYAVSAYKYYDKNMEHLHLITKMINHPAITQGILK